MAELIAVRIRRAMSATDLVGDVLDQLGRRVKYLNEQLGGARRARSMYKKKSEALQRQLDTAIREIERLKAAERGNSQHSTR